MEQWKRGAHGNTYGGNSICGAAALATIDVVEREHRANAATVGAYFLDKLRALRAKRSSIGAVRGRGSRIGMERVLPHGARAGKLCDDLITRAYHDGLLRLSRGQSTVHFMPPLLITTADVDDAMLMLEKSLVEAAAA